MKMLRGFLLLALACGPPLWAQANPQNITSTAQTNCAHYDVTGLVTLGMQVTGTWSATLQPEVAIGGQAAQNAQVTPSNSSTAQATITSNGVYYANVSGATTFFLCATAIASGTASVWFQPSNHVNAGLFSGGGTGGGSAFAAITSGTNTTAAMLVGTGASLGFTGTGTLNANQILGNTVPTLATGFLNWTGSAWAFSAGGGGDTITSPNSTLTVGGTATATTLDLNLATANTWTTPQTFAPSSTSQVALVANNPTSTSVNIAAFKVNNVTEAAIGNSGTITLGDGTNAAGVILKNATSGQVTLKTVAGALGAVSASLPANTGTIAELNLAQTFSAEITTAASATGTAGFNLPPGAAPTAPVNGDLWSTSSGFFGRVAGVTVGPFSASGGGGNTTSTSLTTGFYAEANGANSIVNGTCDSGITTANTFTCSDSAGIAGVSFTGSGSNGGYAGTEGTGAIVVFGAGKSGFYPDSSNHCLHQNLNNVDKNCIPNTAGSGIGLTTGGTISVNSNVRTRSITFTFGAPEGSALTAPLTRYVTVPFGCTISAFNLLADAGTFTVKFWKVATGTAIPTVTNSISTSGVSLATGTALHSTTVTDFTTTTVTANDIMAANVGTVATAKMVQAQLECDQ